MKANTTVKRRGRPSGALRKWYGKTLPKLHPTKVNPNATKEVEVFVPKIDSVVRIDVPKGYTVIPGELTDGKTQANVGQTARNEAKSLNINDKRFIVHSIEADVEVGKGKNREVVDFTIFAVETQE